MLMKSMVSYARLYQLFEGKPKTNCNVMKYALMSWEGITGNTRQICTPHLYVKVGEWEAAVRIQAAGRRFLVRCRHPLPRQQQQHRTKLRQYASKGTDGPSLATFARQIEQDADRVMDDEMQVRCTFVLYELMLRERQRHVRYRNYCPHVGHCQGGTPASYRLQDWK